jgi:hypothetical protein
MVIYKITNIINGKSYIGQTIQDVNVRWNRHKSSPYAIGNAIRKYGEENFKIDIMFNSFDIKYLNNAEKELIKVYNTLYPNGYNLMEGGQIRMTKTSIEKMRKSKLGKKEDPKNTEKRMKKIRKKIYCFETDTVYKSIKEAAKELGIGSPSNLAKYTRQGKPTKGFHFKFIEDKDMTNNNLTGGGLLPS